MPTLFFDRAVLAGVGGCALAMAALHAVQPELSVLHGPVSFYVHGRGGWLLPVGLSSCGLAAVVLARAAGPAVGRDTRVNLTILGVGMILAAAFPSDRWFLWEHPSTLRGVVHAFATVVALGAWSLTALRFARKAPSPYDRPPLPGIFRVLGTLYGVGLAVSVASLVAGLARGQPPPFIGLGERLLGLAGLAWLVVFALGARSRMEPPVRH